MCAFPGSHHRQSDQAPSHTEQVEGDTGADQKVCQFVNLRGLNGRY